MRVQSVFLCGVGGQGVLLAAKIVAGAAEVSGLEVRTNEIHGMAQRGGSVTAHVRFGTEVFSPLIAEGSADALGALEHIEALRWAHFLKPGGIAAVSVGDKWGVINKKGKFIINPQYYAISDFVSGLAIVRKENKVGVIDKKGNIIIDIKYDNNDSLNYYGLSMVME